MGQIEGTDIVVLDSRFKTCFAGHARVERLWSGARWAEGPAWFAVGRYLVWSDIPNNRMMPFVEPSGEVSVFPERSNISNGNTVDNQGRLVTCEPLTRRVARIEIDGSISVIAQKWNGKRLNSRNQAVVAIVCLVDAKPARSPRSSPIWFARTASPSRLTRNTSMSSSTPARRTKKTVRAIFAVSGSTRRLGLS
jgi:hypothetical protein